MEKLKAAGDADAVIAVAKDAGFTISADDLNDSVKQMVESGCVLSEEQLEAVAGGFVFKAAGSAVAGQLGGWLGGMLDDWLGLPGGDQ